MTESAWAILGVALFGCVVMAVVARRRQHAAGGVWAERASRPDALRNAELVYVERLFRVSVPVSLTARIDRAYRLPSGMIVLVEFKTRWIDRPFWSDVVQLSAQRLVMEGQAQAVAPYGYVVVKRPSRAAPYTAHRVELMSGAYVVALVHRREDILAGRVRPGHAAHPATCHVCAFRSECERPSIERRAGLDGAAHRPRS